MRFPEATPIEKEARVICDITRGQVRARNAAYALAAAVALAAVVLAVLYYRGDVKAVYAKWALLTCWFWVLAAWTARESALRAREKWKRAAILADMLSPARWEKVRIRTTCPCDAGCTKPSCFRTDFTLSMDREPEAALYLDGHPILHEVTLRLTAEEVARLKSSRL